jgi:peptidoglycan/LPS O-acetylase OafA/YrhL
MGKLGNFDTLRLWAAASVIFSHSFVLAEGVEDNEPFQHLTGEILGVYGVFVFFILSGFLITRSRLQTSTTTQYLWKRFLRIYPAYFVSILVTIILVCPFFTSHPASDFLTSLSTWKPAIKALLFSNGAHNDNLIINGFSFYSNGNEWSMGTLINGVFWTIKIEIILYIAVAVLFVTRLLTPWVVGILAVASTIAFCLDWYPGWYLGGFIIRRTGLLRRFTYVLPVQ